MSTLEQVIWRSVDVEKPDTDRVVMVNMPKSAEWPVWLGYLDNNGVWVSVDAHAFAHRVTHWAEMPKGASP